MTPDDSEAAESRLDRIANIAEEIRLNLLARQANDVEPEGPVRRGRFTVHQGGRRDG